MHAEPNWVCGSLQEKNYAASCQSIIPFTTWASPQAMSIYSKLAPLMRENLFPNSQIPKKSLKKCCRTKSQNIENMRPFKYQIRKVKSSCLIPQFVKSQRWGIWIVLVISRNQWNLRGEIFESWNRRLWNPRGEISNRLNLVISFLNRLLYLWILKLDLCIVKSRCLVPWSVKFEVRSLNCEISSSPSSIHVISRWDLCMVKSRRLLPWLIPSLISYDYGKKRCPILRSFLTTKF